MRFPRPIFGAALGLGVIASSIAAAEPPTLDRIRTAGPVPSAATTIDRVELDLHIGSLVLSGGVLAPVGTEDGRRVSYVYVGDASIAIDPADEVERQQLLLFTGADALEATLEAAVLVLGNPETVSAAMQRGAPAGADLFEQVEAVFEDWLESEAYIVGKTDDAILRLAAGDPGFREFTAAWLRTHEYGDLLYEYDPARKEPVRVGRFVPEEIGDVEEHRRKQALRRARQHGIYLGPQFPRAGTWDTWISTGTNPLGAADGLQIDHYEIEAEIDTSDGRVHAVARIDWSPLIDDRHVVFVSPPT